MAITNLVLVVGAVKAADYKAAQFDLHHVGIPTRVLRMTYGDWELSNVASDILDAIDAAGAYSPADRDYVGEDDLEAQLYLADREADEYVDPDPAVDLHFDRDDEDISDTEVVADFNGYAYEADRVSCIDIGAEFADLRDIAQAGLEGTALRFPRTGARAPISDRSTFMVVLEEVVDLEAKLGCPPEVAAAKLVIDHYLVTDDSRVRAVVMSEPVYHSEWTNRAWIANLPADVVRYVVRPNGKKPEIV